MAYTAMAYIVTAYDSHGLYRHGVHLHGPYELYESALGTRTCTVAMWLAASQLDLGDAEIAGWLAASQPVVRRSRDRWQGARPR